MKSKVNFFRLAMASLLLAATSRVSAVCDLSSSGDPIRLNNWRGNISSPGFDMGIYSDGQDCAWIIEIASANQIRLTFETFDLIPENSMSICEDFVQINDSLGHSIEKCGVMTAKLPEIFEPHVMIRFHSDESGADKGFRLQYEGLCDEDIHKNVTILSPNYPELPPAFVSCTWTIGRPDQVVTVQLFDEMVISATPSAPTCQTSAIKVTTGAYGNLEKSLCPNRHVKKYLGNVTLHYRQDAKKVTDVWVGKIEVTIQERHMKFHTDADFCKAEMDIYTGSELVWSDTLVTEVDQQPCPDGADGHALRNCLMDEDSLTGGLWTRPDLSNCSHGFTTDIINVVLNITTGIITEKGMTCDCLMEMAELLKNSNSEWYPLFPGDIMTLAQILNPLIEAVSNISSTKPIIDTNFIQHFLNIVDNTLDLNVLDILMHARSTLVESLVNKMVNATQHFVINIFNKSTIEEKIAFHDILQNIDSKNFKIYVKPFIEDTDLIFTTNLSSIRLPSTSFARKGHHPYVYFASFFTVHNHYDLVERRYHKVPEVPRLIISDVISVEFVDGFGIQLDNLTDPVVITFLLKNVNTTSGQVYCVYMNMQANSSADRWMTPGCQVKVTNTTHTVCHCYHLTNFAVLMDIYNKQDTVSYANNQALGYISYVGGGLSIVSCLALIMSIQHLRISNDNVRIHQQLGISILLTQVLYLIMDGVEKYSGIPFWACYTIAALLHYTLMAMFSWMLVEGFHLYVKLVWVFKVGSYLKRYLAVSWGCPLIIVILTTSLYRNQYKHETLCWLDRRVLLTCLVPVLSFVILINTVILGIVIRVLVKSRNMTNKQSLKQINNIKLSLKASAILLPLLGLSWVFAYMAVATDGSQLLYYIFTYLFTITNSCQGLLFFIFHGLLNSEMQAAFRKRYMKSKKEKSEISDSRTRQPSYIEGDFDTFRPNNIRAFEMNSFDGSISSTTIGNCKLD